MLKQLSTTGEGLKAAHDALKEGQNVLVMLSGDEALGYYQREFLRGLRGSGAEGVIDMNTFGLYPSSAEHGEVGGAKITFTTLGACRAAEFAEDEKLLVWLCLPWQFGNLLAAEGVLKLAAPTEKVFIYTESAR